MRAKAADRQRIPTKPEKPASSRGGKAAKPSATRREPAPETSAPSGQTRVATRVEAASPDSAATAPSFQPPSLEDSLAPEIRAELQFFESDAGSATGSVLSAGAIARILLEIAALLELTGANAFKVRAYDNAARALAGLGEDLNILLEQDRLHEVRGIGQSIAEKVTSLARTGTLAYHEELKAQVPAGLLEILRIPGLGPKRVKALYDGLGIRTIEELEAACIEGKLENLRGFGAKSGENIRLGIEQRRRVQGTFLWSFAIDLVAPIVEQLRRHPAVQRLEVAGSLRRQKEIVHDVDILLSTHDPQAVMGFFATGPWALRVLGSGETKTSILHPFGLQIDLRAVTDEQFPYALHHFTGSKNHNIAMRGRAQRLGIKMNEYGLFRGEELIRCRDEAEIFAAVGLEYVPPELREDCGEVEAAAGGTLPRQLLQASDLRGAFHVHTSESDGRASLEEMVRAAQALGWEYVGISDHSQSAVYARGLQPERVLAQRGEIERLQQAMPGIRILHGIESDILPDGRLDYDDEILRGFDFVIASVHSAFKLSRDEQTRRLLRAVENPYTTILGHPTGRILLKREGYDADMQAVLETAARHGVAIEINAHPQRLDADGALSKLARDKGALLSINPDAHTVKGLEDVRFGVSMARRGWLEPTHVVNAWPLEKLEAHWKRREPSREPSREPRSGSQSESRGLQSGPQSEG